MSSMQERREAVTKSALFHQQAGSFCYLQEIDLRGLWWKIRLHASRPRYSLVWVESCYIAEHSNGEPFWGRPHPPGFECPNNVDALRKTSRGAGLPPMS